jgi:RimJ/RimL family protein N-acetyltransferase
MIELEKFGQKDFSKFKSWIKDEVALLQFAGRIFTFPVTDRQLTDYMNDNKRIPYKVVLKNSKDVIGHCELNFESELPRLSRIFIGDTGFRNKGYGKLIVHEMLKRIFCEYSFNAADLNVFDWNLNAIKCYEAIGFRNNNENETSYLYKNQQWKIKNMIIHKDHWRVNTIE